MLLITAIILLALVIAVSYIKFTAKAWLVFLALTAYFSEGRYVILPALLLVVSIQLALKGTYARIS